MSMVPSGKRVFQRSADVVCRQVGPESVLVPIRHNVGNLDSIYTLSSVAARVWNLLDGTRDVENIVDTVADEFDVDRETAAADVAELIHALADIALVKAVSA